MLIYMDLSSLCDCITIHITCMYVLQYNMPSRPSAFCVLNIASLLLWMQPLSVCLTTLPKRKQKSAFCVLNIALLLLWMQPLSACLTTLSKRKTKTDSASINVFIMDTTLVWHFLFVSTQAMLLLHYGCSSIQCLYCSMNHCGITVFTSCCCSFSSPLSLYSSLSMAWAVELACSLCRRYHGIQIHSNPTVTTATLY